MKTWYVYASPRIGYAATRNRRRAETASQKRGVYVDVIKATSSWEAIEQCIELSLEVF